MLNQSPQKTIKHNIVYDNKNVKKEIQVLSHKAFSAKSAIIKETREIGSLLSYYWAYV